MTCQVLLNPMLVEAMQRDEPLEIQFDALDQLDADVAASLQALPLARNLEAERYHAAGLTAKAQTCQEAATVQPAAERPLAAAMTAAEKKLWRSYYTQRASLAEWNPPQDLPYELTEVLAALRTAGVFEEVEVWETPRGVNTSKGVLFVGKGGSSRYHAPGGTDYYPIARWTAKHSLTSYDVLVTRRAYSRQTLSVLGSAFAGVALLAGSYVLCFRAPDIPLWIKNDGWWIFLGGFSAVAGASTSLVMCEDLHQTAAAWIRSKLFRWALYALVVAGIVSMVGSVVAYVVVAKSS